MRAMFCALAALALQLACVPFPAFHLFPAFFREGGGIALWRRRCAAALPDALLAFAAGDPLRGLRQEPASPHRHWGSRPAQRSVFWVFTGIPLRGVFGRDCSAEGLLFDGFNRRRAFFMFQGPDGAGAPPAISWAPSGLRGQRPAARVKASGGNTAVTGCDGFKPSSSSSGVSTLPVRFARSPANCRSVVITAQGSSISSSWCSWVSPAPLAGGDGDGQTRRAAPSTRSSATFRGAEPPAAKAKRAFECLRRTSAARAQHNTPLSEKCGERGERGERGGPPKKRDAPLS